MTQNDTTIARPIVLTYAWMFTLAALVGLTGWLMNLTYLIILGMVLVTGGCITRMYGLYK